MGYSFSIGEGKLVIETFKVGDDYVDAVQEESIDIRYEVEYVHLPEAPAFGEPTDHENQRWPSYTVWHDFLRSARLEDAFLDENHRHLRGHHPGHIPVTPALKAAVDKAYHDFKEYYPDVVATYESDRDQDAVMCRLEWLKFWIDWSLENCENPVMVNT